MPSSYFSMTRYQSQGEMSLFRGSDPNSSTPSVPNNSPQAVKGENAAGLFQFSPQESDAEPFIMLADQ